MEAPPPPPTSMTPLLPPQESVLLLDAMPLPKPPPSASVKEYVHKQLLHQYTKKAGIAFPEYQTFNEGSQHDPKFRTSVVVDGKKFVSPHIFRRRKEAEHYAAKFAFENIYNMIKHEGVSMLYNDTTFSKSILHEYAAKMRLDLPEYTTSRSMGQFQTFSTCVLFDGKTYTGGPARNIKEAEQIGARTVIEFILGQQSETMTVMAEIIKSKGKLFNALHNMSGHALTAHGNTTAMTMVPIGSYSGEGVLNRKDMQDTLQDKIIVEHNVPSRAGNLEVEICGVCSGYILRSRTEPTLLLNNPPEASDNNPPEASTSQPVYIASTAQIVHSESEITMEPPITSPGATGKRSCENVGGQNSKKMRADEQSASASGVNPLL